MMKNSNLAENTKAQMRKGILEYCILLVLSSEARYSSDILQILKEEIPLFNEGLLNQLVEDFNFKSLLSKEVNLLSGGENQILKFILLFCQSADVYALDEPLQYLDGENLNKILKYILDISNEKVLLIIEHKRDIFKDLRCHEILMEELEHRIVIGERFGI